MNQHLKKAFTLVELIFVIVIIGILSSVALPKFRGLSAGAKISAEIATISSVVTALEAVNGEWSINEGSFTWGTSKTRNESYLSTAGYPKDLNSTNQTFGEIIKINSKEYTTQHDDGNITIFTGPASDPSLGVSSSEEKPNKPDKNDFWIYAHSASSSGCTESKTNKILYPGDFVLIDVTGATATNYSSITCH